MNKKRPFILWELMIGIAIISLAFLPMLPMFYKTYQKEVQILRELELERISNQVFADFLQNYPIENLDPIILTESSIVWETTDSYSIDLSFAKEELYYGKVHISLEKPKSQNSTLISEQKNFLISCMVNIHTDPEDLKVFFKEGPFILHLQKKDRQKNEN